MQNAMTDQNAHDKAMVRGRQQGQSVGCQSCMGRTRAGQCGLVIPSSTGHIETETSISPEYRVPSTLNGI